MDTGKTFQRQQGLILVTSLVLLVVLTLLAVSAINSSTLGTRMATNQQEKNRALQAADAALAHVESLMSDSGFTQCMALFIVPSQQNSCAGPAGQLARAVNLASFQNDPSAGWHNVFAQDYADTAFWQAPTVRTFELPTTQGGAPIHVVYRVDYLAFASQSAAGDGRTDANFYFLISARADGASPAASAMAQSVYEIDH
ncbi:PilX N-terminal domain-containing pilus assembly protein [Salinisphaera sp. Q1T1-3]|uniref:pilus assembly PilX family protein n=1 Tax=Salinisphaera sp. Q1T1-3 TaxID=2321229 RepID=UPI000E75AD09|nr:PilX N-terminal domain-containing pilus assembly protein [Salinisphaera sp. Q1T1-3]RJS95350.1 hypothetical protein D3260_02060 [Salinisphaera sp. Q1T1-3]